MKNTSISHTLFMVFGVWCLFNATLFHFFGAMCYQEFHKQYSNCDRDFRSQIDQLHFYPVDIIHSLASIQQGTMCK